MLSLHKSTIHNMSRIGLLIGSSRHHGNHVGLSKWLQTAFTKHFTPSTDISLIEANSKVYGPLIDDIIPMTIKNASEYSSPEIQAYSSLVSSLSALVILTPQYNFSFPGELKNALDHLYSEWKSKPVYLVTYGGRGGGKAAEALTPVLEGGLGMKIVSKLEIKLPYEVITTAKRVGEDEETDKFLKEYEEGLEEGFKALEVALKEKEYVIHFPCCVNVN